MDCTIHTEREGGGTGLDHPSTEPRRANAQPPVWRVDRTRTKRVSCPAIAEVSEALRLFLSPCLRGAHLPVHTCAQKGRKSLVWQRSGCGGRAIIAMQTNLSSQRGMHNSAAQHTAAMDAPAHCFYRVSTCYQECTKINKIGLSLCFMCLFLFSCSEGYLKERWNHQNKICYFHLLFWFVLEKWMLKWWNYLFFWVLKERPFTFLLMVSSHHFSHYLGVASSSSDGFSTC